MTSISPKKDPEPPIDSSSTDSTEKVSPKVQKRQALSATTNQVAQNAINQDTVTTEKQESVQKGTHAFVDISYEESFIIPAAPGEMPESRMVNKIKTDLQELKKKIAETGPVQSLSEQIEAKAKEFESRREQYFDQSGNIRQLDKKSGPDDKKSTKSTTATSKSGEKAAKMGMETQRKAQQKDSEKRVESETKSDSPVAETPVYSKKEEVKNFEKSTQQEVTDKTTKHKQKTIEDHIKDTKKNNPKIR